MINAGIAWFGSLFAVFLLSSKYDVPEVLAVCAFVLIYILMFITLAIIDIKALLESKKWN